MVRRSLGKKEVKKIAMKKGRISVQTVSVVAKDDFKSEEENKRERVGI